MTLIRTALVFTAAQGVLLIVGLASSIVISRALGPEGRGVLALVTLVVATTTLFATFGLGTSYAYLAGKHSFGYDELIGSTVVVSVTLGAITVGILMASSGLLLDSVLRGMTWLQFVTAAASIPFAYLTFFLINLLIGAGRAGRAALMQLCAGVFGAVLSIAAVVLAGQSVSVVVLAGTVGTAVIACWCLSIAIRDFGIRFGGSHGIGAAAIRYGGKVYLGTLSGQFWLRADVVVLNSFAGTAAVGQYSLATSLAEKVWLLDSSVSQATLSRVIGSTPGEAARLVARTSRNVMFLAGGTCLALGLAAPWLVPFLFGEAFRSAVVPLWLLLPGVLFLGVSRPLSSYFSGQEGRPQITSAVSVATAVVGVGAYLTLVPPLGAIGAAIGSSIAYAVPLIVLAPLLVRSTGLTIREILVVNADDLRLYLRTLRGLVAHAKLGLRQLRR